MKIARSMSIILLSLWVAACTQNPFGGKISEVDPGHHPGFKLLPPTRGTEFVQSSIQNASTVSGQYKISASLTCGPDKLYMETTPRGYKAYSNIQGALIVPESIPR